MTLGTAYINKVSVAVVLNKMLHKLIHRIIGAYKKRRNAFNFLAYGNNRNLSPDFINVFFGVKGNIIN